MWTTDLRIEVSEEEREELERLSRSLKAPHCAVERARTILLLAAGESLRTQPFSQPRTEVRGMGLSVELRVLWPKSPARPAVVRTEAVSRAGLSFSQDPEARRGRCWFRRNHPAIASMCPPMHPRPQIRQRHSAASLVVHLVWATHHRDGVIAEASDPWFAAAFERIAREVGCVLLAAGNASDHVHLLVRYPAQLPVSELARRLKGASSHAWNAERSSNHLRFAWQSGFWAESVSPSETPHLIRYVREQRAHHHDCSAPEPWQAALS